MLAQETRAKRPPLFFAELPLPDRRLAEGRLCGTQVELLFKGTPTQQGGKPCRILTNCLQGAISAACDCSMSGAAPDAS